MSVNISDTIETVTESNLERRTHWKDRIEYFAGVSDQGCSWTRETFESDLKELRSEVQQVDNRIGELETSIDDKRKQLRNRLNAYDESGNVGLEDLEGKNLNDGSSPTHGAYKELVFGEEWLDEGVAEDSVLGLQRKRAVFQEIKSTLRKIAVNKLSELAFSYKRDFVSGEVADTVQEDILNRLDDRTDNIRVSLEKKLESTVSDLDSRIKVLESRLNDVENRDYIDSRDLKFEFRDRVDDIVDELEDKLGNKEQLENLEDDVSKLRDIWEKEIEESNGEEVENGENGLNYECNQCGYEWEGRSENPSQCPECNSSKWNEE